MTLVVETGKIYTFKVKTGKHIVVREGAVVAPNDYVADLPSGAEFDGQVVKNETDQIWVLVVKGIGVGFYGAVRYKNEEFADIISTTPTPPPTDTTSVNADVHITIRNSEVVGVTVDGTEWSKPT